MSTVLLFVFAALLPEDIEASITVASFGAGSPASFRTDDPPGLRIAGFAAGGSNLAYWGTLLAGGSFDGSGVGLVFGPTNGPLSRTDFVLPVYRTQSGTHQAIAFDSSGHPVVTFTERASPTVNLASGNKAHILSYDSATGQFVDSLYDNNVGIPRNSAVAVANEIVAVYSGSDRGGPGNPAYPGPDPETIVHGSSVVDRHSLGHTSNFSSPLEFDGNGNLYQAYVTADGAAGRDLHSITRTAVGTWADEIIDHNNGFNMTGAIDMALNLDELPVIIGNSAGDGSNDRTLSIHELTDTGWREHGVFLDSIFGHRVTASSTKQIVTDGLGNASVALFSDLPGFSEVAYIRFNSDWSVAESRTFNATKFYGLGVDDEGVVYVGYEATGTVGPDGDLPEPTSLAICSVLGLVSTSVRWRRQ